MTKTKSILTILVVALLLAGGIWLAIYLNNINNTPTSTVELNLNPSVQFVVIGKNNVLSVNYLNEDAEIVFSNIKSEGKDVAEVAKEFAQVAIDTGFIDISLDASATADQNAITISVTGNAQASEELSEAIKNKINGVFDENGVFARAVIQAQQTTENLVQKYSDVATNLKLDLEDLKNKSEEQILALIHERSQKIKDVSASLLDNLSLDNLSPILQQAKNTINDLINQIEDLTEQLNTSATPTIVQNTINSLQSQLKELQKSFEKQLDNVISTLKQQSAVLMENIETSYNNLKTQYQNAINAHKQAFEQNKEATLTAIEQWRAQFEA